MSNREFYILNVILYLKNKKETYLVVLSELNQAWPDDLTDVHSLVMR